MSSTVYARVQNAWQFITTNDLTSTVPVTPITHGSQIPMAYINGLIGLKPNVALTTVVGLNPTTDNQVYENLDIQGAVIINANNVTFKNCRITNENSYRTIENGLSGSLFSTTTLIDCEIIGNGGDAGVAGSNFYVLRTVFRGSLKDAQVQDDCTFIECYMNDHPLVSDGSHVECILRNSGSNLTIQRCYAVYERVADGVSSAISAYEQSQCHGFLLEDCYIGGGGYAVYAGGSGGQTTNVKIRGNIFGRDMQRFSGWAGPIDTTGRDTPGWEFSGNTWGAHGNQWQSGDPEAGALVVI